MTAIILLRPMHADDLAIVNAIEQQAHLFPWDESILRDCLRVGYECWVLLENNSIQGFAMMTIGAGEAHVVNVAVRPSVQRRGYGKQLMLQLLKIAKEKKLAMLFLEVRRSNAPALHLYETLGFNQIHVRKDYYEAKEGREDAIVLGLQL